MNVNLTIKDRGPTLEMIRTAQALMATMPQIDMPLTHHFAPGLYAREIFIPAGSMAIGKMHATTHMSILLEGDITILMDGERKRVQGPLVFTSRAGTKRAVRAHADARLITLHVTDETDIEALEHQLITPEPEMTLGDDGTLLLDGEPQ